MKAVIDKVAQLAVSAIVSVGFVAFAGKAVLWARFEVLQVPQDQVVKAVPQSEAVAVGASILLIFGFFGVLATLGAYLVDRDGRATPGMSRALLGLVALEGVVAIAMTTSDPAGRRVLAAAFFVILAFTAFAMTFSRRFAHFEDTNPSRDGEELEPRFGGGVLVDRNGNLRLPETDLRAICGYASAAVLVGAALLAFPLPALVVVAGVVVVLALVGVVVVRVRQAYPTIKHGVRGEVAQEKAERRASGARVDEQDEEQTTRKRLQQQRPFRLRFNLVGVLAIGLLMLFGVALPALILAELWLVVSLGSAALIGLGLWRIAGLSKSGFAWFGLATILSVPLFGTLTLMTRNLAHPEVQPMAMIRSTDGPDQSIQGLYVTETSDRVYFANVATEGCSQAVQAHSGRLFWVPSSEVVALSIGPLQSVKDAGRSALEMSYALTPSVETPAAGAVSLTVREKRKKIEEAEEAREVKEAGERAPQLDRRLESPGPAVRPNFGTGLRLVPEIASPRQVVELRLRVPNPHVNGFGAEPNGHALRLNGAPLAVLREQTPDAGRAEFVKTTTGTLLSLDKEGVYPVPEGGGEPSALDTDENEEYEDHRYVRLAEGSGFAVEGSGGLPGRPRFLRIVRDGEAARLAGKPMVVLEDGEEPSQLRPGLLRQAWENDAIRFRVPDTASSGVVTVECEQLAGQPLLRVSRAPTARIAVRMQAGSGRIVFNSSRSGDEDGEIMSRHWRIEGLSRGHKPKVALNLPPRRGAYSVELTVTDDEGRTDTAKLRLLRLKSSLFAFGKAKPHAKAITAVRRALLRAVRGAPPAAIELDGHADNPGTIAKNLELSLERDDEVLRLLSEPEPSGGGEAAGTSSAGAVGQGVRVEELAYGEGCPIDPRPGRRSRNRRVDVFVLSPGATVKQPVGCHPGRLKSARWHPPAHSSQQGATASDATPSSSQDDTPSD